MTLGDIITLGGGGWGQGGGEGGKGGGSLIHNLSPQNGESLGTRLGKDSKGPAGKGGVFTGVSYAWCIKHCSSQVMQDYTPPTLDIIDTTLFLNTLAKVI